MGLPEGSGILQGRQPRGRPRPDEDGRPSPRDALETVHPRAVPRPDVAATERRICQPDGERDRRRARHFGHAGEGDSLRRYAAPGCRPRFPDRRRRAGASHRGAAHRGVGGIEVSSPGCTRFPARSGTRPIGFTNRPSNELHTAQASLQGAQAKGKKKEVEDANSQVAAAQKKVDDARVNLDSIAKSKTEDIIRPYTYKKTTYDVINRVVLQFRIDDIFSGQKGEPVQVAEQDQKQVRDAYRREGGRRQRHQVGRNPSRSDRAADAAGQHGAGST